MFCFPLEDITLMVTRRRTMPAAVFSCRKHAMLNMQQQEDIGAFMDSVLVAMADIYQMKKTNISYKSPDLPSSEIESNR